MYIHCRDHIAVGEIPLRDMSRVAQVLFVVSYDVTVPRHRFDVPATCLPSGQRASSRTLSKLTTADGGNGTRGGADGRRRVSTANIGHWSVVSSGHSVVSIARIHIARMMHTLRQIHRASPNSTI